MTNFEHLNPHPSTYEREIKNIDLPTKCCKKMKPPWENKILPAINGGGPGRGGLLMYGFNIVQTFMLKPINYFVKKIMHTNYQYPSCMYIYIY
jgi:hypothetical protein